MEGIKTREIMEPREGERNEIMEGKETNEEIMEGGRRERGEMKERQEEGQKWTGWKGDTGGKGEGKIGL